MIMNLEPILEDKQQKNIKNKYNFTKRNSMLAHMSCCISLAVYKNESCICFSKKPSIFPFPQN